LCSSLFLLTCQAIHQYVDLMKLILYSPATLEAPSAVGNSDGVSSRALRFGSFLALPHFSPSLLSFALLPLLLSMPFSSLSIPCSRPMSSLLRNGGNFSAGSLRRNGVDKY
jgi:hypothetical protein